MRSRLGIHNFGSVSIKNKVKIFPHAPYFGLQNDIIKHDIEKVRRVLHARSHITTITPVLQDFADFFSIIIISFQCVPHFGVGRSQIETNMKVKWP